MSPNENNESNEKFSVDLELCVARGPPARLGFPEITEDFGIPNCS